MKRSRLTLVVVTPLVLTTLASAQPERLSYEARLTAEPLVIDGRLDDSCWKQVPALADFTQVLPFEGTAPSERTEVRFVYTRDQLYVGIRCVDSDPHRIIAKQMQRDSTFDSDDVVEIAFDTFARERDGYSFAVNPAGARRDALFGKIGEENVNWDTLWQAKARVDDRGWTVEIAIPFKSLSFDPRAEAWGLNIERIIRRKQEKVRWTALSRSKPFTAMEDFGKLRGLRDLRQGLGLEIRPYTRATYTDNAVTGDRGFELKGGSDLTYRISPTLTAVGTYNTDFAETDIDERVVNLSRFPVFFPEKRDFFLQDAPLFNFGGLPTERSPYYSRRIGLGVDGLPVDVIGGTRLTGRIGGTSVALLDAYQDSHAGIGAKNLAVGRVSQQVLAESSVGGIFTLGDPRSNSDAWLGGLDFNYQNSRLTSGKVLAGNAYAMFSDADRAGGSDASFGFDVDYPNEPLDVHVFFRQWGEKFEPALGFIDRPGIRQYVLSAQYTWRPNTRWLRSVSLELRPYFATDLDNRVVAEDHDVPVLTFQTPAGDSLILAYTFYGDALDEPFEIRPGIIIPPGAYPYGQFKARLTTSPARSVSAHAFLRSGEFYTGNRTDLGGGLDWRPSRHFSTGLSFEHRNVNLPEGGFEVQLASARFNLAFTPDLTWSTVVQYDNLSKDVGLNSRVRWTWQPGDDVYFVVNQGWDYDDGQFTHLASEVTLKVGTTFRF
jgi:hypothetical protein